MTPADTIVKVINNLTHALKGRRNQKGIAQINALEKNDKILNNMPKTNTTKMTWVTFDESATPPQAMKPSAKTTTLAEQNTTQPSIKKAIIDKPIVRVHATNEEHTINGTPLPRVKAKKTMTPHHHHKCSNYSHIFATKPPTEQDYHNDTTCNSNNKSSENASNSSTTLKQANT